MEVDVGDSEVPIIEEEYDAEEQQEPETVAHGSNKTTKPEKVRLCRLPLAKVKYIMRTDPEVHIISADAVFLVTKATEYFVEMLGKEAMRYVSQTKRKTMTKIDLDKAINSISAMCFLEGMLDSA